MKMNSLVDRRCIEALYRASQAGVPIDINVRGICCLVPGVQGVSETINVVSVVGRFLEHSRIYSFHHGDESSYYIGSADLMPRNLDTRVELLTPVENPELQAELDDTLERCLADDTFAWTLSSDGKWTRRQGGTALGAPRADGESVRPSGHGAELAAAGSGARGDAQRRSAGARGRGGAGVRFHQRLSRHRECRRLVDLHQRPVAPERRADRGRC